jgi:hypothetical protein
MKLLAAVTLGALLAACGSPSLTPTSAPTGILTGTPPTSTSRTESDTCLADPRPLPSGLEGNPCPSAVSAVRALVATLGLTIEAIYLAPDLFMCGDPWLGAGPPCPMPYVPPGTVMHGWVSFAASAKVAAVYLDRSLPKKLATSAPSPPWQARLAAFMVPPAGWEMP